MELLGTGKEAIEFHIYKKVDKLTIGEVAHKYKILKNTVMISADGKKEILAENLLISYTAPRYEKDKRDR